MKLDPKALAIAIAAAIAIIWTICSLLAFALPSMMSTMTAHMIHGHPDSFAWTLTLTGFFVGLIAWCAWSAVTGRLIAVAYNKFTSD